MELSDILNGIFTGKALIVPKKSINLMLESLSNNESPIIVTPCNMGDTPGVITLTNKRIIFTSKVLFNSIKKEFDLKNITGINYESSLSNKLTIISYNEKIVITAIEKTTGNKIIDKFNELKE